MKITTYSLTTGELGAVRGGPTLDTLTRHLREGQGYVPGQHDAATHIVDLATGAVVAKPTP